MRNDMVGVILPRGFGMWNGVQGDIVLCSDF